MLRTLRFHVRHNVVAYLALFIALGGTAVAAKPLLTGADIQDGSLTAADVAGANKDGTAGTPSLRTLGEGAQQAAAGNDARLSDSRTPSGTAGGGLTGTYPNPTIAGGAVGTANFSGSIPAVRVSRSAGELIPDNHFTALTFDTEDYDTADLHSTTTDTSRLTAPVAGIYRVSALLNWNENPNGDRVVVLARNGFFGSPPVQNQQQGIPDRPVTAEVSTEIKLAAGDYVEWIVFQRSGGPLNTFGRIVTMSWVAPG